jgi:hypothetical protein
VECAKQDREHGLNGLNGSHGQKGRKRPGVNDTMIGTEMEYREHGR